MRILLQSLRATASLEQSEAGIKALAASIAGTPAKEVIEAAEALMKELAPIAGARDIRREVTRVRSALNARTPDPKRAQAAADKAITMMTAELAWRKKAMTELRPGLEAYDKAIAGTIGLREQARLPRTEALAVASCLANHRDVSLHF